MPPSKTQQVFEFAAHILIGLVPLWGWIREEQQWPPGETVWVIRDPDGELMSVKVTHREAEQWSDPDDGETVEPYQPLDRVCDLHVDNLGYAIGDALRCAVLIGLLVWRW